MSGFAALVWPTDDAAACEAVRELCNALDLAPGLSPRAARPGLRIWTWGRQPPAVSVTERVTLIGALCGGAPGDLPEADLCSTPHAARHLLETAWGGYVALFAAGPAGAPALLRDPSGAVEVFAWRRAGAWVVASDIEPLPSRLWPEQIAIDWDGVLGALAKPLGALARTPLLGVEAVAPGVLLMLGEPPRSELMWRPAHQATREAPSDAAEALARTVTTVVRRMTAGRKRLLIEVSGGLDSAIVAAAWAQAPEPGGPAFALNYYGDRRESDERTWACALCDRLDLPITARFKPLRPLRMEDLEQLAAGPRPSFSALDPDRDRNTAALARLIRADGILTGGGGDAAFFQAPTADLVADYLTHKGLALAFDPLVQDVARWLGRSIWSVLWEAWRKPAPPPRLTLARFLHTDAAAATFAPHPWLAELDGVPPGKRRQIAALVAAHEGFARSRRADAAPVLQPLLAQPVMELCLAIPTWAHVEGGGDRALARRAFADRLPASLVERRSKGSLTSFYARQAAVSLEVLRPFLLDGALARARLLDRKAVEAALTPERLIRTADGAVLLRAAAVEAWVRRWQAMIPDAAPRTRR